MVSRRVPPRGWDDAASSTPRPWHMVPASTASSLAPFPHAAPWCFAPSFGPCWEDRALGARLAGTGLELRTDLVCHQRQPGLSAAASLAENPPEPRVLTKKHITGILISRLQVQLQTQMKFFMWNQLKCDGCLPEKRSASCSAAHFLAKLPAPLSKTTTPRRFSYAPKEPQIVAGFTAAASSDGTAPRLRGSAPHRSRASAANGDEELGSPLGSSILILGSAPRSPGWQRSLSRQCPYQPNLPRRNGTAAIRSN